MGRAPDKCRVLQVFRYMAEHGLPDETCLTYTATDATKYDNATCSPMAQCLNCMPINTPAKDFMDETCWPVTSPLTYKVRFHSHHCYFSFSYQVAVQLLRSLPAGDRANSPTINTCDLRSWTGRAGR